MVFFTVDSPSTNPTIFNDEKTLHGVIHVEEERGKYAGRNWIREILGPMNPPAVYVLYRNWNRYRDTILPQLANPVGDEFRDHLYALLAEWDTPHHNRGKRMICRMICAHLSSTLGV